jgi:hypothetical protein
VRNVPHKSASVAGRGVRESDVFQLFQASTVGMAWSRPSFNVHKRIAGFKLGRPFLGRLPPNLGKGVGLFP